MRNRIRHKKLLLIPAGLISLVLLPVLCVWYLQGNREFEEVRAMEISWTTKKTDSFMLSKSGFKVHPERDFVLVNLSGDDSADKAGIDASQLFLRQLVRNNDTIGGIQYHFQDKAKYWTLIKVFDILNTEGAHTFIPREDDIWVFNTPPKVIKRDTIIYRGICGTPAIVAAQKRAREQHQQRIHEQAMFEESLRAFVPYAFILLIPLIVLTVLAIRRINTKPDSGIFS